MVILVDTQDGYEVEGKHHFEIWHNIFEIDTKYVPIQGIGRGAYGIVCSATNTETNETVAIKKIQNVFGKQRNSLKTLRELTLLRHLKHENVIGLKDVMLPANKRSFNDLYLVYELIGSDLDQIIKSSQSLSNDHCQYFLFQLLRGLKYLHSANILHRDLKPSNLLINENCALKICDFGFARLNAKRNQFMTECVGTRWYRAPELLLSCENYGKSIDMWSVGCIFAELLGRKVIFPGTNGLDQLKVIIDVIGIQSEEDIAFTKNPKARNYIKKLEGTSGTPFSSLFPDAHALAIDLLKKMLVFDPSKRISVTEALKHPFMSSLYDPKSDPPAQILGNLEVDCKRVENVLREKMWTEILHYHPEVDTS